jgi:hypothetical protein
MIRIYDKLWYITDDTREDNLSYLCQYETTESGEVAANVKKMQATGRGWIRGGNKDKSGNIIDNTPTKNIYVGCSVSRWSTSNKLFRVTDPRGFTIEIPTDNLATLLHHTTVVKGVIQEECVWGKDGISHILLPINSEPYRLSREQQNVLDNKLISVKDIKVGDWVKFFGDSNEYYFCGRVKVTWKVRGYKPRYRYSYSYRSQPDNEPEYTDWQVLQDNKYINLFLRRASSTEEIWYAEYPQKPKIVEILRNKVMDIEPSNIGWLNSPERVNNMLDDLIDTRYYNRVESEVYEIKLKQ